MLSGRIGLLAMYDTGHSTAVSLGRFKELLFKVTVRNAVILLRLGLLGTGRIGLTLVSRDDKKRFFLGWCAETSAPSKN